MSEVWDVVVVGAGPAGTTLARRVAAAGLRVLVLEKDRDVGMPVRCGEAVSDRSLGGLVDVDPRWIAATIRRFRLVSPSGIAVEPDIGGFGYVLERRIFDYDLARLAADAGAVIRTKCCATGLITDDAGHWNAVRYEAHGHEHTAHARVIVGADGVESRVGRWAGIDTVTRMADMESCAQMTMTGIDMGADTCEFHFGADIAPQGYLWIFPKGAGVANVGVGIGGAVARQRSARSFLTAFVERRFPHASVLTSVAGGVPCSPTLEHIVQDNVLLVGDAAHQVNPLSGGGITSGMHAAALAGDAIVGALRAGDLRLLGRYEDEWNRGIGAKHRTYHRIKSAVHRIGDERLDAIARDIDSLRPDKRTIWRVFAAALTQHPALVWEMVRTFGLRSLGA
jgi:digeranylgeranylglycerophospholipid reductase